MFQLYDQQFKFTTVDQTNTNTLVTKYVPVLYGLTPNTSYLVYNPFTPLTNVNNTTFYVPTTLTPSGMGPSNLTGTNYYTLITRNMSTNFVLNPLNIEISQPYASNNNVIYSGSINALYNGLNGPIPTGGLAPKYTSSAISPNILFTYLQDYTPFGIDNLVKTIIVTIPRYTAIGTYSMIVKGSNQVYLYALGATLIRDPSFGYPTSVDVSMYKTSPVSASVLEDYDTTNSSNIITYSIPFSTKSVKNYPLTFNQNGTSKINIQGTIASLVENNISTWTTSNVTGDQTYGLYFTHLNSGGKDKLISLFTPNINSSYFSLYTAVSPPIRVTVDLAGNELSRIENNGNVIGTALTIHP